jgi:hypothetical protein
MTPAEQKYRALNGAGPVHGAIRRSRGVFTFVLVGGTFAILIWMKLRVVGGVPRTAYADPEDRPAAISVPTHQVIDAQPAPVPEQPEPQSQPQPVSSGSN